MNRRPSERLLLILSVGLVIVIRFIIAVIAIRNHWRRTLGLGVAHDRLLVGRRIGEQRATAVVVARPSNLALAGPERRNVDAEQLGAELLLLARFADVGAGP